MYGASVMSRKDTRSVDRSAVNLMVGWNINLLQEDLQFIVSLVLDGKYIYVPPP